MARRSVLGHDIHFIPMTSEVGQPITIEPLAPGVYIVAVSGGVDSMVLLDVLARTQHVSGRSFKLVVAHFDHGIRHDSDEDRQFVRAAASRYGLPFVYERAELGPGASEALARKARYAFLERVRHAAGARAIVTAHHQDDMMETAILNMIRGTAYRGLSSLSSGGHRVRPFLHLSKQTILSYAHDHGIVWREDSTNADERYLRNYIRRHLLPRFGAKDRAQLVAIIERSRATRRELDIELANILHAQASAQELDRLLFIQLPHAVARELLAGWLRAHGITNFSRATLERLVVAAKVQAPGARLDAIGGATIVVHRKLLALLVPER